MPIDFTCPCGQRIVAGDNTAGHPYQCPGCRTTLIIPGVALPPDGSPVKALPVHVVGINMPFWSITWLLIKLSMASIPAMFILAIVFQVVILMLTVLAKVFLR